MPELPEVETTMLALAQRLCGRQITDLVQRRPDLRFPLPTDLPARLTGSRLLQFRRRAKYIIVTLDDGQALIVHLGMSGRLQFDGDGPSVHEHLTFTFDDATVLRFVDARRFGMLDLIPAAALAGYVRFAQLGLEPLDAGFTGRALRTVLGDSITPLKVALMDQRRVVGVGNIYASEALFRARLRPDRPAGSLSKGEADRLAKAIREVLLAAIAAGGSSLRDYVQTDGELGYFQFDFQVYGRVGQPCTICARPIERVVQANRATYFCANCQPAGRVYTQPGSRGVRRAGARD
ncbi:MAG: bifunctional DNA-formamidopyrimidine glycosylase/DNA-(apurinic or apyrimidinic site) lyase [Geminicoccaceae bacterium]